MGVLSGDLVDLLFIYYYFFILARFSVYAVFLLPGPCFIQFDLCGIFPDKLLHHTDGKNLVS